EDGLLVESRTRNPALGHALTIAGGAGGLLAGRWLSTREAYTEGNVHALRSAALLGTHSGLALTRAFGVRDDQALVAGALVGGLAGVALGNRQLRSNRFTAGEGLLVNAAHIAGGAAALGFTY